MKMLLNWHHKAFPGIVLPQLWHAWEVPVTPPYQDIFVADKTDVRKVDFYLSLNLKRWLVDGTERRPLLKDFSFFSFLEERGHAMSHQPHGKVPGLLRRQMQDPG